MNLIEEIKSSGGSPEACYQILAKVSFSFYCTLVHKDKYWPARHHYLICEYLERVERGELKNLIITMPPRHGKSMTVSETFPSWFIGKNPERRVIVTSYSDRMAHRFGRFNKDKVRNFGPSLFGIDIPKWGDGATSVLNWQVIKSDTNIKMSGGMISSPIMGSITGEGADLLIIDDPIKNASEADSETYRDRIWNEWEFTLRSRLTPNGRVIVILTRWHEDDLVGRLLKQNKDKWTILSLPAIAEENDLLGRQPGEALWPEFGFTEKWLNDVKNSGGVVDESVTNLRAWNSLYQQRPSVQEGSILKREDWRYYKELPDLIYHVQSWDTAFKKGQENDPSACLDIGTDGINFYATDFWKKKVEFPELESSMKLRYYKSEPNKVLIEDAASGQSVLQVLDKETDIPLEPIKVDKDKIARANAVSGLLEAHKVFLPYNAPWVIDFIDQCAKFPAAEHDEEVDTLTQALAYLRKRNRRRWVSTDEKLVENKVEEVPLGMIKQVVKDVEGNIVDEEYIDEEEVEEKPRYSKPTNGEQPKVYAFEYNPSDMILVMCKEQGYVPQGCRMAGKLVIAFKRDRKDPCDGCMCDRNICRGRYNPLKKGTNGEDKVMEDAL